MSRRTFLALEAGLGATFAASLITPVAYGLTHKEPGASSHEFLTVKKPEVPPDWWKKVVYETPTELQGKKLSTLEVNYVKPVPEYTLEGVPLGEKLPPIDFGSNLEEMYASKKAIIEKSKPADAQSQLDTYATLAEDYEKKWTENTVRRMDLSEFRTLIDGECLRSMSQVGDSLGRISQIYFLPVLERDSRLDAERRDVVEKNLMRYVGSLATYITPNVMLAYLATELMPAPDRSAALLEFITQHAGVEYLERIPALGDPLLSYGPFQLTKYVVGEDGINTSEAGSVTQLLKVMKSSDFIPKNLSEFTSIEEHIRAGYLFAFHNLISLIQDTLERGAYAEFSAITESANAGTENGSSTVFLEMLAAAHHRPAVAREAMKNWLAVNSERSDVTTRDTSLVSYFPLTPDGAEVRTYAQKARDSYTAIMTKLNAAV